MANTDTLLIEKIAVGVFKHTINGNPNRKLSISDFETTLIGNEFNIVMLDGAKTKVFLVENITIKDYTGAGIVETFTNPDTFENRLRAIEYTPFKDYNATAIISIIPALNRFTYFAGMNLVGQDLTFTEYSTWLLSGLPYTNLPPVTINIPYAATGKQRFDGFAATSANTFVRYPGIEVFGTPVKPVIPVGELEVTFALVTDSTISIPSSPYTALYLGTFDDEIQFLGGIPRPVRGHFAYIENASQTILCLYTGTDWKYIDLSNITTPLFGTFKRIRKGFGNTNLALNEAGDIFEGGVDNENYCSLAILLTTGADVTDSANFDLKNIDPL